MSSTLAGNAADL